MKKLKHGFKSCDWWFNYKSHSFDIVSSKSEPSMRQIGALTLSQWDNLKVKYEEDWTLADLLDFLEQHLSLSVDFMIQSGRMIFNKAMPTHVNKKKKAIKTLVKFDENSSALIHISVSDIEDLLTVQISSSSC